jgi:delta8-fatty-acid desaturase
MKNGHVENGKIKNGTIKNGFQQNGIGIHETKKEAKLIGIDGKWYDITTFIPHHPGGEVIEHFIGKDASEVFHAFHEKDVLKHRRPVGTYNRDNIDEAGKRFADLLVVFQEKGFFKTSMPWYAMKFAITFLLLGVCVYLVTQRSEWYFHYLGAVFLAMFWQQCGFFLHDFMHNQVTHNRHIDQLFGVFFGTTGVGLSSSWWRDEHFVHHALTNTVDYVKQFWDPQMKEPIWAQDSKLYPFYKDNIETKLVRIQHYTFLPVCIIIGRLGIIIDSFKQETRLIEWIAFAAHWTWMLPLLSYLPSGWEIFIFYSIASMLQGVLTVQLLVSHYAKEFFYMEDICNVQDWYKMQIQCNINIKNPIWMDWFHGGLNFHIEHHLYPTMPRHNYREASIYIKKICKDLDIFYDECGWYEAVKRTLIHLKHSAKHFKLDPR